MTASGSLAPACRAATAVVRFVPAVLEVVVEHARSLLPEECCGLLLGDDASIQLAWPARNELASPTRYRVDPRDYIAASRYGRKHGFDVVGAYHSHPRTPALPSPTDVAESAGEHFLYLIVGQVALWPDGPENPGVLLRRRELRGAGHRQDAAGVRLMSRPAHSLVVRGFLTWSLLCAMPELGLAVSGQPRGGPPPGDPASQAQVTQPVDGDTGHHDGIRVRHLGSGTRVRIGGPVVVERGERAEDVVAIFGDITVRGDVQGDAVAVFGSVRVEDGASIGGEVVAVGGRIESAPTAIISGSAQQVSIDFPELRVTGSGSDDLVVRFLPDRHWLASIALGSSLLRLTALLLLALTAAIVFSALVQRVADQAAGSPAESLIIGLGAQLLLVPAVVAVCLALTISVIGLPLVPVVLASVGGLWLVGFAGAAAALGRGALGVFGVRRASLALGVLVGGFPFALLTLISRFGWWSRSELSGWLLALAVAGLFIEAVLWSVGAGALALAWLRRARPVVTAQVPPVMPPPAVPVQL